MDNKTILAAFNNQLSEFLDDVVRLFPNDIDIRAAKNSLSMMKKMNPKLILTAWYNYVSQPYGEEILNKGLEPFIEKNYTEDIKYLEDSSKVLEVIDRIRNPIKEMNNTDKDISLKYINNLNKLSNIYFTK